MSYELKLQSPEDCTLVFQLYVRPTAVQPSVKQLSIFQNLPDFDHVLSQIYLNIHKFQEFGVATPLHFKVATALHA